MLAALARIHPKRTLLALAPKVKTQEELANDLEAWGAPFLFFPQVEAAAAGALPDPETSAERLAALGKLAGGFAGVVLATERARRDQPLPAPEVLKSRRLRLTKNTHLDRDAFLGRLQEAGYTREAQVQGRGQFSVRGAVVGRLFVGRARGRCARSGRTRSLFRCASFDVDAQRSVQTLKRAEISLATPGAPGEDEGTAELRDYLPAGFVEVDAR
ncbi:MAG: hypothetical protein WDO13_16075 [Verrucomicrobiota bacterium]